MKKFIYSFLTYIIVLIFIACPEPVTDSGDSGDNGDSGDSGFAGEWVEYKIIGSTVDDEDNFGISIDINDDGSTIIVGSPYYRPASQAVGAVFVFKWNGSGWDETIIEGSDSVAGDSFGSDVAISSDGQTIIVGAKSHGSGGAGYLYQYDGSNWNETKFIPNDTYSSQSNVGDDVSIQATADSFILSNSGEYAPDLHDGVIYLFENTGSSWNETRITAQNSQQSGDFFGVSTDITDDGERIAVGAFYADDNGNNTGKVYMLDWNGSSWVETAIYSSDPVDGDSFGEDIDMTGDGNAFVAGAKGVGVTPLTDDFYGAIYIYKWNASYWDEWKIQASDKEKSSYFGISVSITNDGNKVLSGAYQKDILGGDSEAGGAYLYEWDGFDWVETIFEASDPANNDQYGEEVALSGDGMIMAIGAKGKNENGTNSGVVYVYRYE